MAKRPVKQTRRKAPLRGRLHPALPVEGATQAPKKWSGRFAEGLDPRALAFGQSVHFDQKLAGYDIQGSLAHARMLGKIGVLKASEVTQIVQGLEEIGREISSGRFEFKAELEDVHRNIEAALMAKIGSVGGKLHTARSRNDQVALDFRLYCRDQTRALLTALVGLEKVFLKLAKDYSEVLMPGYTHLQRAQPILFSHHLLAYVEMWDRDRSRLEQALERMNVLPLGSGALAGTSFALDREQVARELGFREVSHNSLDAVSDRDFAIELASVASLLMMHLSRLSEELILWSSSEFGFLELPQSFCTGSSMMPQKINPDIPELIRGKTGRVYGHLLGLLTLMKSLPLAYNKDMQEDKEAVFDLCETVLQSVEVMAAMMAQAKPNQERMRQAVSDSLLLATDLADWLVEQGSDFRQAHEVVGQVVRYALEQGKGLTELTLVELKKFSPLLTEAVYRRLTPEQAVAARRVMGGTARPNVLREIARLEQRLASFSLPKK